MLKTQATIFCRQCGAVWKYRVGQYLTSLNALLQWVGSFVLVTFVTFSLRYISSYEFRDNSLQAICHISPASRVFLLLIIISSVAVTIFQSLYLGACVLSRTGCLGSWDSYKPIWVQNNLSVSERFFKNRFGPVLVLMFADVMASLYDAWYYVNTKGQIDKIVMMMMEGSQIITPMSTWCFWEMALEFLKHQQSWHISET